MKILQINTSFNTSAPGRIASEIDDLLLAGGHLSVVGYGRKCFKQDSKVIKIGNRIDFLIHVMISRLLDRHGFGSKVATKHFINRVKRYNPDIIHIHNLHGYYIHLDILFNYIKEENKPVIWTLHDCWPFTGHCSYFNRAECLRWQVGCYDCPLKNFYPASWFLDNSKNNYLKKEAVFSNVNSLILVTPSQWLSCYLSKSFLKKYPRKIIYNGVDIKRFKPYDPSIIKNRLGIMDEYIILGVANVWSNRKGLDDFMRLRMIMGPEFVIILIGLSSKQIKSLPGGILGFSRTENIEELSAFYSAADIFVNPTLVDNFPTVNLESLACGTPVVTYDTGGSPESIDSETGRVVPKGNVSALKEAIMDIVAQDLKALSALCRSRAEKLYDSNKNYRDYLNLYESIICK